MRRKAMCVWVPAIVVLACFHCYDVPRRSGYISLAAPSSLGWGTVSVSSSTEAGLGNDDEEKPDANDANGTIAVIHMGIHKTGSTSIQLTTFDLEERLLADGYDMPWARFWRDPGGPGLPLGCNQVNFATCFSTFAGFYTADIYRNDNNMHCNPQLLRAGHRILRQSPPSPRHVEHREEEDIVTGAHNLLVSSEVFSHVEREGYELLRNYLAPWDRTLVVVFYRRYYDWLASMKNQLLKSRSLYLENGTNHYLKWRPGEWTEKFLERDEGMLQNQYTLEAVQRLRSVFGGGAERKEEVVVMNYNDEGGADSVESFFCRALPGAARTCEAVRDRTRPDGAKPRRANAARHDEVDLGDLARAARERGWWTLAAPGDRARAAAERGWWKTIAGSDGTPVADHCMRAAVDAARRRGGRRPLGDPARAARERGRRTTGGPDAADEGMRPKEAVDAMRAFLASRVQNATEPQPPLPRACLGNGTRERIWRYSLEAERSFGEAGLTSAVEAAMRAEFDVTWREKLCWIDAERELTTNSEAWEAFFRGLGKEEGRGGKKKGRIKEEKVRKSWKK